MVQKIDARWLRFGRQLRRLREETGVSQDRLARALNISPSMLSAMERGTRGTKAEYVDQIEHILNTDGRVRTAWNREYGSSAFPHWFRDIEQLQRKATDIRVYHPLLVPGLLQCEEYARTIIRFGRRRASQGEVEAQVQARMQRQSLLDADEPPLLVAVVDEPVLRRRFGGPDTMRRQLDHLLAATDRPHVILQLLPMDTEYHPGLDGAFTLITVPERSEVLYLETRISGTPSDAVADVQEYTRVFGELRGAALSPTASRGLLADIRRNLE
jgi:transcriptional regulator with XRE-family HTH domain